MMHKLNKVCSWSALFMALS